MGFSRREYLISWVAPSKRRQKGDAFHVAVNAIVCERRRSLLHIASGGISSPMRLASRFITRWLSGELLEQTDMERIIVLGSWDVLNSPQTWEKCLGRSLMNNAKYWTVNKLTVVDFEKSKHQFSWVREFQKAKHINVLEFNKSDLKKRTVLFEFPNAKEQLLTKQNPENCLAWGVLWHGTH